MPYKPTGRPNGRPPKKPKASTPKAKPFPMKGLKRMRASLRRAADQSNPHPAVTVYDSRGRPRDPKTSHHGWIGTCRPT